MRTTRWIKAARNVAFAAAALLTVLLAIVQVSQHVFRRRVERLLTDVHLLRPGVGGWTSLQPVMVRWGRWATDANASCTAARCDYQLEMRDWVAGSLWELVRTPQTGERMLLSRWFRALHANLPSVRIDLRVEGGEIVSLRQTVETFVPEGDGPGWMGPGPEPKGYLTYRSGSYELLAETKSEGALNMVPDPVAAHPNFRLYTPSGCEGCMGFIAAYGMQASAAEYDFLSSFNLSCITRWSRCSTENDMLPGPWQLYRQEHPRQSEW